MRIRRENRGLGPSSLDPLTWHLSEDLFLAYKACFRWLWRSYRRSSYDRTGPRGHWRGDPLVRVHRAAMPASINHVQSHDGRESQLCSSISCRCLLGLRENQCSPDELEFQVHRSSCANRSLQIKFRDPVFSRLVHPSIGM